MSDSAQPEGIEAPHTDPGAPARERRRFWCLMAAALLHGLAYLLLLPPWMGEDEPWHLEYAHHVAAGHRPWGGREVSRDDLAEFSPSQAFVVRELGGLDAQEVRGTQDAITDSMERHHFWERVDWASWGGGVENFDQVSPYFTATHQPPLYYLLTGQVLALLGGGDVLREMWVERVLSLFAYLAVVAAAYQLGKRVSPDPIFACFVALLVAWWPMHARQAAVVNNDVLAKVASAWTLVLAIDLVRLGLSWKRAAWAFGLAALGLALKTTSAGVLAPLGLAFLWRSSQVAALQSRRVRLGGALAILGMVAAAFMAYRFSNNPAIPDTLENLRARFDAVFAPEFLREFGRTAVGAFNWYSRDLPAWQYAAVGWSLGLALFGLGIGALRRVPDYRWSFVWLCLAGCLAQFALVLLRGTAAGRYVMPMLPAFAILAAVGLLAPWSKAWRERVGVLVLLALLIFDGYFLWSGLVWNQYGVWGS